MKFIFSLFIILSTVSAFADVQVCSRVDDADDWRLYFDFAKNEVALFDNDTTVMGEYKYTVETVQGVDVFESTNPNDPWVAEFYGDRKANGNTALLILGDETIEFVCEVE